MGPRGECRAGLVDLAGEGLRLGIGRDRGAMLWRIRPPLLKLQESDTIVVTSFADVVGFRGGSATATNVDFVVGIGKTSGVNAYKFIDTRPHPSIAG